MMIASLKADGESDFPGQEQDDGCFHEDGEYTEETSLVLLLIDADRNTVQEIAKDLCAFFHQESVLITENQISGYFVREEV